jgi:hypothetical protein
MIELMVYGYDKQYGKEVENLVYFLAEQYDLYLFYRYPDGMFELNTKKWQPTSINGYFSYEHERFKIELVGTRWDRYFRVSFYDEADAIMAKLRIF